MGLRFCALPGAIAMRAVRMIFIQGGGAPHVGRRMREKAARRAARSGGAHGAGHAGSDIVEVDLGGGAVLIGRPDFMGSPMAAALSQLKFAQAPPNVEAENQKTEAPCAACGRLMPAAERCAACRASGVWYCAGCHARLERMTGVGPVFD